MEKTSNYQLNQWEATDPLRREDFNRDNAAVDAALKAVADEQTALSQGVAALNTALETCGNCKIAYGSYIGTGSYGSGSPNTLTFSFAPKLLLILPSREARSTSSSYSVFGIGAAGDSALVLNYSYAYGDTMGTFSMVENTASWYDASAAKQLNQANVQYFYIAIG